MTRLYNLLEEFWGKFSPPDYVDQDEEIDRWHGWIEDLHIGGWDGESLNEMLHTFWVTGDRRDYPMKTDDRVKQQVDWNKWVKGAKVEVIVNWFPRGY